MSHAQPGSFELYPSAPSTLASPVSPSTPSSSIPAPAMVKGPAYTSIPSSSSSSRSPLRISDPNPEPGTPTTMASSMISGEALTRMRSKEQQMLWGATIHWFLPSLMFGLLLFGFLGAVAHHLFYDSLDGKEAKSQLTMVRIGTALAFFTKAMLVGSVIIAYRQRTWQTLREKNVSLKGIDGMFAVVEDPTHFATKELYLKAKIGTAMAVATWIIPLASVLSPAALTTELTNVIGHTNNCNVSQINFSLENTADWRRPRHRPGDSLAFYNITPPEDLPPPAKAIDYYDQPSFAAYRLVTLTILGHQPIPMKSPCVGWNCTWTIEFDAPWYNCTDLTPAEFIDQSPNTMNLTYDDLAPVGGMIYFGYSDSPEYPRPQPFYNATVLTTQGQFPQEPRLWFGYSVNTTQPAPAGSEAESRWGTVLERKLLRCELQKARYKVKIDYVDNTQASTVTVSGGVPINPQNGPVITPLTPGYHEYSVYHSLGALTRSQVIGSMTQRNKTSPVLTFSPITQTKLVDVTTAYPNADFKDSFQNFFQDIIITLLSEDYLEISERTTVPCELSRYQNNFRYRRTSLWVGYAFSILITTASIVVGGFSLQSNGISSDTTFSKILVTTRNRTLDKLVAQYEGVCLGGDPFPKELEDTQLRFGVIDEKEFGKGHKHAAFGTAEEVIPILKGDSYERLSKSGSHYQSSSSWVPRSPDVTLRERFGVGEVTMAP